MLIYTAGGGPEEVWIGCRKGDGFIVFGFLIRRRPPDSLLAEQWHLRRSMSEPLPFVATVTSGNASARRRDAPMGHDGGVQFNATLPVGHPVVRNFARTGLIRLHALDEVRAPPPAPKADASALVTACAS
ncbi:hypothetical protein [Phenylobacterium sp.]|uniref:hypothetical protein n=1 Tax=Phenylobacterium sp. TaxID=1871053 RepID=UPI002733F06E|nr:hypothetical protein [Phenylobacterium sp.]MDP3852520.1 hypothetical protein [Phenylobacterium sp.]